MGAQGTATLDFGAFPGMSDTVVQVAQTSIGASSAVEAWIVPADTADHKADEHLVETLKVIAGNVAAGVGFTIYGVNISQTNEPIATGGIGLNSNTGKGTRLYGTWNVGWVWN